MRKATWLVDGVPLDDPDGRWLLEAATSVPAPASRTVASTSLPSRDGVLSVRQGMGTGTVALSVAVVGTGRGGDLADVDATASWLAALLSEARTVTWQPGEGRSRSVDVVETVVAEPEIRGRRHVVISAALTVHPWWVEDTAAVTSPAATVTTAGVRLNAALWAGVSGRQQDAIVRVSGRVVNPLVVDVASGTSASYTGTIPTGTHLYIASWPWLRAWTSTSNAAWSIAQGTEVQVDYGEAGPLIITPALETGPGQAVPQVTVSASGVSGATAVMRGRRWHL